MNLPSQKNESILNKADMKCTRFADLHTVVGCGGSGDACFSCQTLRPGYIYTSCIYVNAYVLLLIVCQGFQRAAVVFLHFNS